MERDKKSSATRTFSVRIRLRYINHGLSLAVVLLALYIILLPVLPSITLWWQGVTNAQPPLVRVNSQSLQQGGQPPPDEVIPAESTLVIPKINLQEIVHEGSNASVLSRGLWHRPATSTPDAGGNTVIAGHRFTYRGAAVFYHLDKVAVGDKIVLYWDGKKYEYTVTRTYVVPRTAIEVEQRTADTRLTLYTCTPLWTSKSRLVVEAKPVEVQ